MSRLDCGGASHRSQSRQRQLSRAAAMPPRWRAAARAAAVQIVILLFIATAALADDYTDGVAAVEAKNYAAAIVKFRAAITQAPREAPGYFPYYWIGVAKYYNGDVDGALQVWHLSEVQGAIRSTPYYAQMKDYVARAQSEKQKSATSDPKKAADAAISRAIAKQGDAMSHGRDRTQGYRNGQAKLQLATSGFRNGDYANAMRLANEASDAFDGNFTVIFPTTDTAPPPVESHSRAEAELAVQEFRRRGHDPREAGRLRSALNRAKTDAEFEAITRQAKAALDRVAETTTATTTTATTTVATTTTVAPPPPPPLAKPNLEPAYRAYATGDLGASEAQLTKIIAATPSAEAFLLRGCARFTKATLTRTSTDAAAADFREALHRDDALHLDPNAFSPKVIAFFNDVRARSQ